MVNRFLCEKKLKIYNKDYPLVSRIPREIPCGGWGQHRDRLFLPSWQRLFIFAVCKRAKCQTVFFLESVLTLEGRSLTEEEIKEVEECISANKIHQSYFKRFVFQEN